MLNADGLRTLSFHIGAQVGEITNFVRSDDLGGFAVENDSVTRFEIVSHLLWREYVLGVPPLFHFRGVRHRVVDRVEEDGSVRVLRVL